MRDAGESIGLNFAVLASPPKLVDLFFSFPDDNSPQGKSYDLSISRLEKNYDPCLMNPTPTTRTLSVHLQQPYRLTLFQLGVD
jgi:hypothetical protein